MQLEALDHVGLAVSDVARSVAWYSDVLGLRRAHEQAWGDFPAVLEANGSGVALFPRTDGHPVGPDDPLRHVGFRTSRAGLERARAELLARRMSFDVGDYGIAWSGGKRSAEMRQALFHVLRGYSAIHDGRPLVAAVLELGRAHDLASTRVLGAALSRTSLAMRSMRT